MPRILLGVCGGIAAYKALEFTRLALKAGPQRARGPDRGGHALRRAGVVRRHHRRARARSASGSRTRCAASSRVIRCPSTRRSRTSRWSSAPTSYLIAPGDRADARQARARRRRQPADRRRAGLPATADRRSGHEQRDVRASGHAGEPRDAARARRDRARAGHRARSARRASSGSAGCPSRPSCWPRSRARCAGGGELDGAERARHRGRHARADRRGALRRQPLLRAHGVRARRGGQAPRRQRHGRGRERVARRARRASTTSTSRPPPSSPTPAPRASTRATC